MRRLLGKITGFLSNRTMVGVDKTGNKYFTRKEEVDGVMKEKRWVIFKGEEDPTSIPVEWICWLNGQRKMAPTPEVEGSVSRGIERESKLCVVVIKIISKVKFAERHFDKEMMELEARRERVRQNVALLKKEEDRIAKEGSKGKRVSTGKVSGPDLKSFIQQFPVPSEGNEVEESASTMGGLRNPQESLVEKAEDESESSEPTGSGASFKPGTWQPPT
ncbi:hypothetical protein Fmac_027043 [Flemingia macrophylla]|uniref:NADH dehydrogenase [ubiquinone] 1 alpha subcomplex subunit 12 n=1 Tax=Flemingia macrophylla TaxID=520843 RepID=A0ABD1LGL2_9FABA